MATSTPRFKFPYLAASQSQKEATVNTSLAGLDAFIFAVTPNYAVNEQPTAPVNGDLYVIPPGSVGTWAGKVGQIAWYSDGWRYADPFLGMRVIDKLTLVDYIYNGTAWVAYSSAGGTGLEGGVLASALEYAPWVTVASAATVNLGLQNSNLVNISGNVTITSFGPKASGAFRVVRFLGSLQLANNASIILLGGQTITTQPGDMAIFASEAGDVWRCVAYSRADGSPVVNTLVGPRRQINNADATLVASDRQVAVIAIAATRTLTLPAASAFPQGAELVIFDETGALTSAIKLNIAAAGSDLINGLASFSLEMPYGHVRLVSNGVGKWTITELGDNNAAWTFYTPTVTIGGGTLTTASAVGRYKKIGKTVHLVASVFLTTITSGTGTVRITLPFPAQTASSINMAGAGRTAAKGLLVFIDTTAPTLVQMSDYAGATVAVSGTRCDIQITYETSA